MSNLNRFLFKNGVVCPSPDTPPVTTLLQLYPGAYTTTRTHNNCSQVLFWERHLRRLCNSTRILLNSKPQLLFRTPNNLDPFWSSSQNFDLLDMEIRSLVNDSLTKALPIVLEERVCQNGEEFSITALVSGNDNLESVGKIEQLNEVSIRRMFAVYLHVSGYGPPVFGIRGHGANLAVVGNGRDVANAKYSDWVRLRKPLEKLRPPSVTELLLSNDGDRILEGCLTNFFIVCLKDEANEKSSQTQKPFELQTAPLGDGVLPGVAREVIIEFVPLKLLKFENFNLIEKPQVKSLSVSPFIKMKVRI